MCTKTLLIHDLGVNSSTEYVLVYTLKQWFILHISMKKSVTTNVLILTKKTIFLPKMMVCE